MNPALVQPDGSVVIPPALADEVLRRLARSIVSEAREAGVTATPAARALLAALDQAAQRYAAATPTSVGGSDPAPPATVEVTADEAGRVMGCTARWARDLAASGRVQARRVGRTWLIDSADLDRFRHGRTAA